MARDDVRFSDYGTTAEIDRSIELDVEAELELALRPLPAAALPELPCSYTSGAPAAAPLQAIDPEGDTVDIAGKPAPSVMR